MSGPLVLALPGQDGLARELAAPLAGQHAAVAVRDFPDGEPLVRLPVEVAGRDVVLAGTLDRPAQRLVPLLLAADAARELGARRLILAAPYLPFLRQDARFREGEAVASRWLGRLLSAAFDAVATVDPHLHRHASLDEVLSVPSRAASSAGAVAAWLRSRVPDAFVVGGDSESARWVGAVAARLGAPCVVLAKTRRGDRDVEVAPADGEPWPAGTPVLVDDIVSTGRTLAATVRVLRAAGLPAPWAVGIHAVMAEGADEAVATAGLAGFVTCNTIPHASNAIDARPALAEALRELLG